MTSRLVIAALCTLLAATPAFAKTDLEKFNKLIAKVTKGDKKFKPRVSCVCLPEGLAGYVLRVAAPQGPVLCVTPSFDPDGSVAIEEPCSGPYEVLGR